MYKRKESDAQKIKNLLDCHLFLLTDKQNGKLIQKKKTESAIFTV